MAEPALAPLAILASTAGSIRHTLAHLAGAEQRYVMLLNGRQPTIDEDAAWPGVPVLRDALDASGRALIDLAAGATGAEVLTGTHDGQPYSIPATTVYIQTINHAPEHRSQIATILTQLGLEPPDFSGWAWDKAGQTR